MLKHRSRDDEDTGRKKFKYKRTGRTVEGLRKRQKSSGLFDSYILSDFTTFKPKEGENVIRILPPTWEDNDGYWDLPIFVHFGVGPDNSTYLCLDKMKGEPCPVCEARRNAADKEEADQFRPSERRLCWLIDRNNEKAGPLVYAMPASKMAREIHMRSEDKKTKEALYIDDPDEGYDVSFRREGTTQTTNYSGVEVDRDPSPLHDEPKIMAKWLQFIQDHPLTDVLNYYDPDHIEKVLSGQVESKRGEDDEDDDTTSRKSMKRKPARAEEEEEEETEEEEEGEGEEEEESEEEEENDGEEEEEESEEEEDEDEDTSKKAAPRSAKKARSTLGRLRKRARR
jgi:hypothetical protein